MVKYAKSALQFFRKYCNPPPKFTIPKLGGNLPPDVLI